MKIPIREVLRGSVLWTPDCGMIVLKRLNLRVSRLTPAVLIPSRTEPAQSSTDRHSKSVLIDDDRSDTLIDEEDCDDK